MTRINGSRQLGLLTMWESGYKVIVFVYFYLIERLFGSFYLRVFNVPGLCVRALQTLRRVYVWDPANQRVYTEHYQYDIEL